MLIKIWWDFKNTLCSLNAVSWKAKTSRMSTLSPSESDTLENTVNSCLFKNKMQEQVYFNNTMHKVDMICLKWRLKCTCIHTGHVNNLSESGIGYYNHISLHGNFHFFMRLFFLHGESFAFYPWRRCKYTSCRFKRLKMMINKNV